MNATAERTTPDMLAALKGAMVVIDLLPWPEDLGDVVRQALLARRQAILDAIAKAAEASL